MQPILLTLAAGLILGTMLVHSILGQSRLIRPLLDEGAGVMKNPLARWLVPFAWHLTSFVGLIVAATLLALAWAPERVSVVAMASTGIVFTIAGIWDAIGSKGKHIGWPLLLAIGLVVLGALVFG